VRSVAAASPFSAVSVLVVAVPHSLCNLLPSSFPRPLTTDSCRRQW